MKRALTNYLAWVLAIALVIAGFAFSTHYRQ